MDKLWSPLISWTCYSASSAVNVHFFRGIGKSFPRTTNKPFLRPRQRSLAVKKWSFPLFVNRNRIEGRWVRKKDTHFAQTRGSKLTFNIPSFKIRSWIWRNFEQSFPWWRSGLSISNSFDVKITEFRFTAGQIGLWLPCIIGFVPSDPFDEVQSLSLKK